MTEIENAWAAGLFEGEGCFSWTRKGSGRRYPVASLSSTDEDVVLQFAVVVGVGKVKEGKHQPGRKRIWRWRAFGIDAMRQLDAALGPHLGQRRRERLDELLTFVPEREGERGAWIGPRHFGPRTSS